MGATHQPPSGGATYVKEPGCKAIDKLGIVVSVNKKFRRQFRMDESGLICRVCERVNVTCDKRAVGPVRLRPGDVSSIVVSPIYLKPHTCLLSTLREIEWYKHGKLMSEDLYDEWFNVNSDNYQLGASKKCMQLWGDFTKCVIQRSSVESVGISDLCVNCVVDICLCKKHLGYYVSINWGRVNKRGDIANLNEIWQWSSAADKGKTNVSAADLIWHMRRYPELRARFDKWSFLFSIRLSNVTITSLLIHLIGNPSHPRVFELLDRYDYCCLDSASYSTLLKNLSVALRRTAHWPDGSPATLEEVTQCSGWELAVGRSENRSDWAEEESKRTNQVVHLGLPTHEKKNDVTNSVYCALLEEELTTIMSELVTAPRRSPSWKDYVETRQVWVSSGSTGGKRMKMNDGTVSRVNKHAYFESLTTEEMVAWMAEPPRIQATASEKYEMGKARAIYGTEPVDYAISSYVLDDIEDHLYNVDGIESGLTDMDFLVAMVRRLRKVEGSEVECTMIDYSDFNYQHTLEAQSLVFKCLSARLRTMGHHDDKVAACDWVAAAMLNQWCKFPGVKRVAQRVVQGMFSGVRGTNFINTTLNVGYYRVARRWVSENLNLRPTDEFNLHQGDDVWISNKSRLWAMAMYESMQSTGLIFQPSKQMFDTSRGEFLRVVYTSKGCQGYLARAVGTLIVKPIQSTEVVAPAERAHALSSQIAILHRRGFTEEGSKVLWEAVVPYAARAKLVSGALTIPVGALLKSSLDNGLDIGPPMTAAGPSDKIKAIPSMVLSSKALEESVPSHMSTDWAKVMSRRLQSSFNYDSIVEALHSTNVTDSLRQEDRIKCLRVHERDLRSWLERLRPGTVRRDRQRYDALMDGESADAGFEGLLDTIARGVLGKRTQDSRGVMGCIMAAVSSSPYRSLPNAKLATGLPTLSAATVAIAASPYPDLSMQAASHIASLRRYIDDGQLCDILDGLSAGANQFECEYHPVILSWIEKKALDRMLTGIMTGGIVVKDDLRQTLVEWMRTYVRSLNKFPVFKQISKY